MLKQVSRYCYQDVHRLPSSPPQRPPPRTSGDGVSNLPPEAHLSTHFAALLANSRCAKYQSVTFRSPLLATRASASCLERGGGTMTGLPGTQLAGVEQALASEV